MPARALERRRHDDESTNDLRVLNRGAERNASPERIAQDASIG